MNRDELRELIRKQLTATEENTIDNILALLDQQRNEVLDEVLVIVDKTLANLKEG